MSIEINQREKHQMPDISQNIRDLMRDTLLSGGYNVLLGAGANHGARDRHMNQLPLSEGLRQKLIKIKDLRESSSLSRAYAALSAAEVEHEITYALSKAVSSEALRMFSRFYWKRIYTFNVDDALEDAYEKAPGVQTCRPFTHASVYQNPGNVNEVQIVHVHGSTRSPQDGYVFSLQEYARGMGPGNSWVNILSQTMRSESFIIAGTILEEPDLEYFLAGRTKETARTDRGPSFLIEPYPDAQTINDCSRHGLELFTGTFEDFIECLNRNFESRPLPVTANSSLEPEMFNDVITKREIVLSSRDISYLTPVTPPANLDFGFYVGRQPTFSDIGLERDVPRLSGQPLRNLIKSEFDKNDFTKFILIEDGVGTGKSTTIKRVLYDLTSQGLHVFIFDPPQAINIDLCAKLFNKFKQRFIVFCDDFADFGPALMELDRQLTRDDVIYVVVERSYRIEQVRRILGGAAVIERSLSKFTQSEARNLILKMDAAGLTAEKYSDAKLDQYALEITNDSIATAVCRVMEDFRPMDRIVKSVVDDADEDRLTRYIACAIAVYCYRSGLPFNVLSSSFSDKNLRYQFNVKGVLPLTFSDPVQKNYVIPANPVLADLVLKYQSLEDPDLVFDAFCSLAVSIGFYVNRKTIRSATPEARLGRRLFDYDEVVYPLLRDMSESFYLRVKKTWDWNSRYWEQLALLKLDKAEKSNHDARNELLAQAVSHARHAVKIERHPNSLTTLGKVLMTDMRHVSIRLHIAYEEGFRILVDAANLEGKYSRIAIHPYKVLFDGTLYYINNGGKLDAQKKHILRDFIDIVEKNFPYDTKILINISNLGPKVK